MVVPSVGQLVIEMAMYRFASNLALLLKSGVPMMETMHTIKGIFQTSPIYRDALGRVAHKVAAGKPLYVALDETGLFLPMLISMVQVGEESGQLAVVMEQVAPFFKEKMEGMILKVTKMVEPIIIMGMGIVDRRIDAGHLYAHVRDGGQCEMKRHSSIPSKTFSLSGAAQDPSVSTVFAKERPQMIRSLLARARGTPGDGLCPEPWLSRDLRRACRIHADRDACGPDRHRRAVIVRSAEVSQSLEQSRADVAGANLRAIWAAQRLYWLENRTYAPDLNTLVSANLIDPSLPTATVPYGYAIATSSDSWFTATATRSSSTNWNGAFTIAADGTFSGSVQQTGQSLTIVPGFQ